MSIALLFMPSITFLILMAFCLLLTSRLKRSTSLLNYYLAHINDLKAFHNEELTNLRSAHMADIEKILNDFQKHEMTHGGRNV